MRQRRLAKPGSARTSDLGVSSKPPNVYEMGLWKPGYQPKQGTKQTQIVLWKPG
jgi:hypothetical protein